MPSINQLPSKEYPEKANIRPQSLASGASVSSGWIPVSDGLAFARVLVNLGVLGAGTVDVKVEQATSAGGAGVKDLLTAAQTGVAATSDDNTTKEFEFRPHEIVDVDNAFTHFRVTATAGGGVASLIAASVQYGPARYQD